MVSGAPRHMSTWQKRSAHRIGVRSCCLTGLSPAWSRDWLSRWKTTWPWFTCATARPSRSHSKTWPGPRPLSTATARARRRNEWKTSWLRATLCAPACTMTANGSSASYRKWRPRWSPWSPAAVTSKPWSVGTTSPAASTTASRKVVANPGRVSSHSSTPQPWKEALPSRAW